MTLAKGTLATAIDWPLCLNRESHKVNVSALFHCPIPFNQSQDHSDERGEGSEESSALR